MSRPSQSRADRVIADMTHFVLFDSNKITSKTGLLNNRSTENEWEECNPVSSTTLQAHSK